MTLAMLLESSLAPRRSRRACAAGGRAAPAQPPAPDGLFDGVFGARSPAVVATGSGAARREDPLADLGGAWDPWDAAKEDIRPAEAAAGGPPSRRCAMAGILRLLVCRVRTSETFLEAPMRK